MKKRKRQADLQKSLTSNSVPCLSYPISQTPPFSHSKSLIYPNRARTQRIKQFSGEAFWSKKKWKVLGLWEIGDTGVVNM